MVEYGRPPPYGGAYDYEEKRRGGNFCVRCICCCYCFLFLLIIILASLAFYFYIFYKPRLPTYEFKSFEVKNFGFQPANLSVSADFIITMKADNPNTAIGLIYGKGSSVNVTYRDSNICTGKLPAFHQGQKNTTIFQIELFGKTSLGSGLHQALQDNEKNGKIPLKVLVNVPVQIVLGELKLRQVNVFANVTVTMHDLKPGKKPEIEHSKPTISVKF